MLVSWCPLVPKFSIETNPSTGAAVYWYGAHEHRGVREQQGAEGEGVRAYGCQQDGRDGRVHHRAPGCEGVCSGSWRGIERGTAQCSRRGEMR